MFDFSTRSRVVTLAIAVIAIALLVAPLTASATLGHDTLSLNVTPSTLLNRAGQNVTASGAIVPQYGHTGMSVKIALCKTTCTTVVASTPLSAAGLYSTTVPVTLCEPGCFLKATIIQDTNDTATAAISFAPPSPTTTTLALSADGYPTGSTISVPFGTVVHAQATVTTPGTFPLNGVLGYKLYSDSACTVASGSGINTTLPANAGADAPSVSILVPTPGTYYWQASYQGDANNLASSTTCNAYNVTYTQPLVTSIEAAPDPVTAGQLVQYELKVTNTSVAPISGVNVTDTLPAGTTLFSASSNCTGSGPVTCALGTIAGGGNASASLLVTTGSPGVITDTATATPGSNNVASIDVTVQPPVPGQISGFVVPGGSLDTGGNDPAKFSLPTTAGTGTGTGGAVSMTQEPGNFCAGPCSGIATTISPVDGYTDPTKPVVAVLTYSYTSLIAATNDYLHADVYKFDDATEVTGSVVNDCKDNPAWSKAQKAAAALRRIARVGTRSGIANPAPCLDARSINIISKYKYTVTFTVLYLSGDPHLARSREGAEDPPARRTQERFVASAGSAVSVGARWSAGTRPRETQLRLSAHTSIGGRTTSALSSAIATLSATIWPKSCSSGSDDVAMTATPEIAVSADTMKARPVRDAATSIASRGGRPRRRSSTKRSRISDVNSVHAATTSGPPTAVIGLSLRLERVREQRRRADRDQHRHERQQRADDAAQPDRQEQEHEEDRDVGEDHAVRLEVVEQADADDRETRRSGARSSPAGARSRGSRARPSARASSPLGPVRKMMFIARAARPRPSRAGCRAARRRTRLRTSAAVGVRCGAPGTSLSWLTVLTSPDAVSSVSGYLLRAASRVKSSTNVTVGCANTSRDCTYTPSSLDEWTSWSSTCEVLDDLRLLVDPLDRVGLQHELALDEDAAREDDQARDRERRRDAGRRAIRATRSGGRAGPRGSRVPFVGERYSRMPRIASVPMMLFRQIAATPMMSSSPNSRSIGTLAKRNAANAKIASNVTTSSAGPRLRAVSWIGCVGPVDHDLFLDARVHLDRVVDADTEHHRQPGDRDDRERDAEIARDAERPDDADQHDAERQQPPAHVEQHEQDHAS